MKKKLVSLMLVTAMAASMTACGSSSSEETAATATASTEAATAETEAAATTAASGEGSVYMLNFKPETDQAWQDLAATYTEQTGVEVTVLTAADGQYSTTQQAEMAKGDDAPTIFNIGNTTAAQTWNDYTLDLKDTALYDHLTDKSLVINYDNKVAAVANCYECYGIIYNKTILADYCTMDNAVISSAEDIKDFDTLKAVAEDINARVDEINEQFGYELTGAFTSAGLDDGSSWRFSGHLANLPLYYEFLDDGCDLIAGEAEIDGTYLDQYKNVWDLYTTDAAQDKTTLATGGYDAEAEFKNGSAVFYQNGSWEYAALSEVYTNDELAMIPIYCGAEGEEKAGLCSGTENCWAVNAKASEEDIQATLDFMYWIVTSEEGTTCFEEQFGIIPYKQAAETSNVFLQDANNYLNAGCYNVDWTFNYTPNVNEWRAGVVAAMNQYDAGGDWADVETAFVAGWANQYKAAYGD